MPPAQLAPLEHNIELIDINPKQEILSIISTFVK